MKVAISGVGGGVGQSILKALTLSSLPVDVLALDVQPYSAGLYLAEDSEVVPKPESPGGLAHWENVLRDREIDALIPGSDHDLVALSSVREHWGAAGVCQVLVSDPELVSICRDKAATCQVLQKKGLPAPVSVWGLSLDETLAWADRQGYPLVIKPRRGYASRQVNIVTNAEELRFFFPRTNEPIIQELLNLSGTAEEYTCSVFVDQSGQPTATFMARRELSGGATYRAEIGYWPEIDELLRKIGRAFQPTGVMNVQLRQTDSGPVPFELNIRCSGTSAIRAYFGYNEPEMLLRHYVLGEDIRVFPARTGYVFRYWNEVFLDNVNVKTVAGGPMGKRGRVIAWP